MEQKPVIAAAKLLEEISELRESAKNARNKKGEPIGAEEKVEPNSAARILRLAQGMTDFNALDNALRTGIFVNRTYSYSGRDHSEQSLAFIGLDEISNLLKGQKKSRPFLPNQSPLYAAMEVLIDKGYGRLAVNSKESQYSTRSNFLQHVGEMPIFAKWCKYQDPNILAVFLHGSILGVENMDWLLQNKPKLVKDPNIFFTVCQQLGHTMAASTPTVNWQNQPTAPGASHEEIQQVTSLILKLKQCKQSDKETDIAGGWTSGILKHCLLHPAWVKAALGNNPTLSLISQCTSPEEHSLSNALLEKTSLGSTAWKKEPELLRHLIQQLPTLEGSNKKLGSLQSPEMLSLYLEHPSLQGRVNFNNQTLSIIEQGRKNNTSLPAIEKCISQLAGLHARLAQFDFYELAKAGASISVMGQALEMSYGSDHPEDDLSFSWLAETNRPDLFSLLPAAKIPWSIVGFNLPNCAIHMGTQGPEILPGPWKDLLTSEQGKDIISGALCRHMVSLGAEAPSFIRNNTWLHDQQLDHAAAETQLPFRLGKASKVHTALEVISLLKLNPTCFTSQNKHWDPNTYPAHRRNQTLERLLAEGGKPNHLQRYLQLGGEFTSTGLLSAIEGKRQPNLDIMLDNFHGAADPDLPLKYLEHLEKRITPSFLRLVKHSKPEAMKLLPHLSGYHHEQDLQLLYTILLEQNEPQELFNSLVSASSPLCDYHPDLLRKAVGKGADPTQPIWILDQNGLCSKSLEEMLPERHNSNLTQELRELHQARQLLQKDLDFQSGMEVDLF